MGEELQAWIIGSASSEQAFFHLVDWAWFLIASSHDIEGNSDGGETSQQLNLKSGSKVILIRDPKTSHVTLESDLGRPYLEPIIRDASGKPLSDLGEFGWWETRFETPTADPSVSNLQMIRSADQHRRFKGAWRLGLDVLVEFEQRGTPEQQAFPPLFPNQSLKVRFRSAGPGTSGPGVQRDALRLAAHIRTILSFVSASPLTASTPMVVPLDGPGRQATSEQLRPEAPTPPLTVDNCVVWEYLNWQATEGSREALERSFNAMLAFEHGMSQPTLEAATVFFVTAMEALAVPNHRWKTLRVTKRFQMFIVELCNDTLLETIKHGNFAQIFGDISNPKELAAALYNHRSKPAHSGNFGLRTPLFFPGSNHLDQVAVSLIAQIARSAILHFLIQPRSSLYGHPSLDTELRLELTQVQRMQLEKLASEQSCSVAVLISNMFKLQ